MSRYHIRSDQYGIYAGTHKTNDEDRVEESDVTEEALCAVTAYLYSRIKKDQNSFGLTAKIAHGVYITLSVNVTYGMK